MLGAGILALPTPTPPPRSPRIRNRCTWILQIPDLAPPRPTFFFYLLQHGRKGPMIF